jgi:F0F1-type ATP synthase assembly protein I
MNSEKKELFRALGLVSSMGISVVVAIAIGVWAGLSLDKWLGTAPWFFYIFLFFGIAAGFRNIYIITGKEIRRDGHGENNRR